MIRQYIAKFLIYILGSSIQEYVLKCIKAERYQLEAITNDQKKQHSAFIEENRSHLRKQEAEQIIWRKQHAEHMEALHEIAKALINK